MAKILVIEDTQTESLMMNKILTSMGHSVVTVTDGEAGLVAAEKELPSLIFLDIVIPKMDGFQVCRKIKRNEATKDIPVILISSKTKDSDKFWGLKQGASDYLGKPITEETLKTAVRKILSQA